MFQYELLEMVCIKKTSEIGHVKKREELFDKRRYEVETLEGKRKIVNETDLSKG